MQEMQEAEELRMKERTNFKATPVRMNKNAKSLERVKSDRKVTVAVAPTMASTDRSVKREIFE